MIGLGFCPSVKFAVFDMFTNVRHNCEHFKLFERYFFFITLTVLDKNVTKPRRISKWMIKTDTKKFEFKKSRF